MTSTNNLTTRPTQPLSLGKCVLIGAAIALTLTVVFLVPVKHPDPAWGKLWMARPLLVVTFAGAVGGACYFFLGKLRNKGGWNAVLANVLSAIIYIFGMWMGMVLGLAGMLWH